MTKQQIHIEKQFRKLMRFTLIAIDELSSSEHLGDLLYLYRYSYEKQQVLDHITGRNLGGSLLKKFDIENFQLFDSIGNMKKGSKREDYRSEKMKRALQVINQLEE